MRMADTSNTNPSNKLRPRGPVPKLPPKKYSSIYPSPWEPVILGDEPDPNTEPVPKEHKPFPTYSVVLLLGVGVLLITAIVVAKYYYS